MNRPKIGIRPTIDGRWGGARENNEEQTMRMAEAAKKILQDNVFYSDGTPVEVVVASSTIGGSGEAAICDDYFVTQNVCATLTVTPTWCFGSEVMDLSPTTIKAVWGFNGTEMPGAVFLAAAMAAHAQRGLPAFAIYGQDVQDKTSNGVTPDVEEKIIRFGQCAIAVAQMKNKTYVNLGSVSMGIAGSCIDVEFFQKYLGIRAEWVDMTEIARRVETGIFDPEEYKKVRQFIKEKCPMGLDNNSVKLTPEQFEEHWDYTAKMTLAIQDIMYGNPKLKELGYLEESLGKNAILGGFQGQRAWTNYKPNGDFAEAILSSSFDWNGKKEPKILATENDGLNGLCMLFAKLLTGRVGIFADVRTYWSKDAVKRVTGYELTGDKEGGFIHLINSGAAALDGTGVCTDDNGKAIMKQWWNITEEDIDKMLKVTKWAPAIRNYFSGGGFSSQFKTHTEMPVTLIRVNIIDGIGPVLQLAEGKTVTLPEEVDQCLLDRTDPTWPSTWFVPRTNANDNAFKDVYSVMANWGANHGAFCYGHIGKELITLASMLRIPVSLHNIDDKDIYRPHSFSAFGTKDLESADYRACQAYGPLYK